ncbi:hypothetical protein T11_6418 [Trichinella zimbabwensis]|uniref:Uncharacterized protein n=1 Tax=Trichinella zimbabwensis TaxID=268475 RepID=A0A0V1H0E7_9BILA|nr:hypothetical protein T11_6418 [Trichinella zimbabwensis]
MQITIAIKYIYIAKSPIKSDFQLIVAVRNKCASEANCIKVRIHLQQRSSNALKPVSNAALCK